MASRFEQVPGFFVRFVFLVGAARGEEEVAAEDGDDFGGEDIPDIFGDDVDGEEVDLVVGVIVVAGLDGDDVSAVLAGDGLILVFVRLVFVELVSLLPIGSA
jgi:hypothetical protein